MNMWRSGSMKRLVTADSIISLISLPVSIHLLDRTWPNCFLFFWKIQGIQTFSCWVLAKLAGSFWSIFELHKGTSGISISFPGNNNSNNNQRSVAFAVICFYALGLWELVPSVVVCKSWTPFKWQMNTGLVKAFFYMVFCLGGFS